MLRRLLGMALVLGALAGCTKLGRECQSEADCAEGEVCQAGYCFKDPSAKPPPVEPDQCQPACGAAQTCTREGCRASFSELKLVSPEAGSVLTGGTVTVRAQLTKAYDVAAYPSTLSFSVTPVGGTETALTAVTANTDGTYTAEWTLAGGETEYDVKVAYAEAGLSATVRVKVDTVGPAFTVVVPEPPTVAAADGFTYARPGEPAFRRDQTVLLTVQSTATDVDLTTFNVTVRGVNGGADLTNLAFTGCTAAAFCIQANVNLWEPGLNDFSGSFAVEVEGKDLAGNAGVRAGASGIPVTRWRWVFDAGALGDIKGTPAVGESGRVYVGTASSSTAGNVIAIAPEGSVKWQKALGAVAGSPAVGKPRGGDEYVYVGTTAGASIGAQFQALSGSTGDTVVQCPGTAGGLGGNLIESAIAVGTTDAAGQYETAMGIYNATSSSARIVSIRPDVGTVATDKCGSETSSSSPIPHVQAGASVVMRGTDIFYGTNESSVTSYAFESRTPRTGWPVGTTTFARGLALLGDKVHGAAASGENRESGGVFTVPQAGNGDPPAAATFVYPSATPSSRVFNLAIGGGGLAFFGAETNAASNLVRMDLATPATRALSSNNSVGSLQAAPVIGRNGLLYTVNTGGQVQAWAADSLSSRWGVSLPGNPQLSSPTLDCMRDVSGAQLAGASVGVLYVPIGANLYSIVVDSPALDTAAPWPKYQRDARNSGNPATPITSCQ